jgi:hypothetical protein
MPIKNTNVIVIIFIILLLLVLYIFTNNSVNRANNSVNRANNSVNRVNNSANHTNKIDTFMAALLNNDGVGVRMREDDDKDSDSINTNIINNKIRIRNRDNSLLQQYIKSDSSNNEKEHFQMGWLSTNNNDEHIDAITTVPIANTLINNDKYKGYNNYVSLRTDSYAPVTSIGKQLITAFSSYPIAS